MAYTDAQYQFTHAFVAPVVTGTATASATNGVNSTSQLHAFPSAFTVSRLRILVTVVPKTANMALVVNIMNGTSTVGAATMGTNSTAGSFIDATLTTNTALAAASVLTAVVTGSATASADTIGSMAVLITGHDTFS